MQYVASNPEIIAAVIFCAAAIIGQICHALKKWAADEVDTPALWFTTGVKRTIAALAGNIGGMLVFIQTGVLSPMLTQPNGWWAIFLFGFLNGFSADSGLNKATKSVL